MPNSAKGRKRMVVVEEEVAEPKPQIAEPAVSDSQPVEEKNELLGVVKEKVEELQGITEHISSDVEKSADVQEEIAQAAEKATPPENVFVPQDAPRREENGLNPLVILIPGVLLLGALLGGIVFYQNGINSGTPGSTVSASPTPSVAPTVAGPTASPAAALDLTKFPIVVQNGSGIVGEAGKVKDLLTTGGFKVSSTGNATSYDFTKTVIKAKADVPAAFLSQLSTLLSKTYVLDSNQALATSSASEVIVIVGSSKAK